MQVFVLVSLVLTFCHQASGHGRMMEPPSRASAWRVGFPTPRNYDDNALFCGGYQTRQINGGKCGVCGDPWNGERENEAGGRYATGTIVRYYKMDQIVTVKIDITANHWGWFEFRICPNNDVTTAVTHACLNRNLLHLADGNGTRYMLPSHDSIMYTVQLKLPPNMVCTQCVLQWKYHGANVYGVDKVTGRGCVGCGPQVEFYACADVAIEGTPLTTTVPTTMEPDTTTAPIKTNPPCVVDTTIQNCIAIGVWRGVSDMDMWCTFGCARGHCPPHTCLCSGITAAETTTKPTTAAPTRDASTNSPGRTYPPFVAPPRTDPPFVDTPHTNTPVVSPIRTSPSVVQTHPPLTTGCIAINVWVGNPDLDKWCNDHCPAQCPPLACDCSSRAVTGWTTTTAGTTSASTATTEATTTTKSTSTPRPINRPIPAPTHPSITAAPTIVATTTATPLQGHFRVECIGINHWAGNDYLDRWCNDSCGRGNCPPDSCLCTKVALNSETTTTTRATTTPLPTQPAITAMKVCRAIGIYQGIDIFDQWCTSHCNSGGEQCPADSCACVKTSLVPIQPATTTRAPTTTSAAASTCSAKNTLSSFYWNKWCQDNCDKGVCAVDVCNCRI